MVESITPASTIVKNSKKAPTDIDVTIEIQQSFKIKKIKELDVI